MSTRPDADCYLPASVDRAVTQRFFELVLPTAPYGVTLEQYVPRQAVQARHGSQRSRGWTKRRADFDPSQVANATSWAHAGSGARGTQVLLDHHDAVALVVPPRAAGRTLMSVAPPAFLLLPDLQRHAIAVWLFEPRLDAAATPDVRRVLSRDLDGQEVFGIPVPGVIRRGSAGARGCELKVVTGRREAVQIVNDAIVPL